MFVKTGFSCSTIFNPKSATPDFNLPVIVDNNPVPVVASLAAAPP